MDKLPIRITKHPFFTNLEEPWRTCCLCSRYTADQPTGDDDITITGGRLHPESEMTEYEGKWYCNKHFEFRFGKQFLDEAGIDISEYYGE